MCYFRVRNCIRKIKKKGGYRLNERANTTHRDFIESSLRVHTTAAYNHLLSSIPSYDTAGHYSHWASMF